VSHPHGEELHPGPGYCIRTDFERPPACMQQLADFPVPDISDILNRLYAIDSRVRLLTRPGHRLCGPVCTVRVFPGDNLMVIKALDVARPGDIIAIAAHGDLALNAVVGDILATKAKLRGIAGFVVDGLVRDLAGILELDLPVFARGTTAVGPLKRGPGEINRPIACGGVVVHHGDALVADASGLVVVPRESVKPVVERLAERRPREEAYMQAVQRGEFSSDWIDERLARHRCPIDSEGDDGGV
jgi:regulator of RNase E activity RraA